MRPPFPPRSLPVTPAGSESLPVPLTEGRCQPQLQGLETSGRAHGAKTQPRKTPVRCVRPLHKLAGPSRLSPGRFCHHPLRKLVLTGSVPFPQSLTALVSGQVTEMGPVFRVRLLLPSPAVSRSVRLCIHARVCASFLSSLGSIPLCGWAAPGLSAFGRWTRS